MEGGDLRSARFISSSVINICETSTLGKIYSSKQSSYWLESISKTYVLPPQHWGLSLCTERHNLPHPLIIIILVIISIITEAGSS